MSKLGPISHFLSPVSCDSLVLQGLWCYRSHSLILITEVQHGTSWQRTLLGSEQFFFALQKDDVGYKKITKTLKLSCSTVAKTIQRFNRTGSTQNRPRHGRPKKLSELAQCHIQKLCLGNRRMSAASIAAEVEGGSVCQCSDHTSHTASNWSAWLSFLKEVSSNDDAQASRKQFAEDKQTKDMDYCPVVWWDQDTLIWFRWCQACGGNQVRSTKTSVSCLQSSMVVGVSWSGGTWVLTTCTVTYWSRAWSPPFRDWAAGQYSNMITTPNTLPRRPLPC